MGFALTINRTVGSIMKKAAVVILLFSVGIGGALLFRKPTNDQNLAQQQSPSLPAPQQQLPAQSNTAIPPTVVSPPQGVPAPPPRQRIESPQSQPRRPAVLQPGARPPLPQLSEFSGVGKLAIDAPLPVQDLHPSIAAPKQKLQDLQKVQEVQRVQQRRRLNATVQFHTIVNGDTLKRISRRYLGDALWADAIYQMNRGIISDPDRLPLGQKIRIPQREQLTSTDSPSNASTTDLVPLPQWTLKKSN